MMPILHKNPVCVSRLYCSALTLAGVLALLVPGVKAESTKNMNMQPFGKTSDGHEVFLYTLRNQSGMEVKITNYGGTSRPQSQGPQRKVR